MKHIFLKKVICIFLSLSISVSLSTLYSFAQENPIENNKTLALEDTPTEIATVNETCEIIDPSSVPEIIGYKNAVAKSHIRRLYNDEGNDLHKIVFMNSDGSKTLYCFDYPVKYVDHNGKTKDITLDIASCGSSGDFETAHSSLKTTFSKRITDGIRLTGNNSNITLVPKLPSKKISLLSQDKLSTNVFSRNSYAKRIDSKTISYYYDKKTSIEYSLTYTGFKEDIVVTEYTGQTEYNFTLYTNGLELSEKDDSLCLIDSNKIVKAELGDIIIFTADNKNNTKGKIVSKVIKDKQEYLLTIVIDSDFLSSKETKYPIRIDPTIEINYGNNGSSAISDVTINSNSGSSSTSGSLFVGLRQTYGISRVLMKFPALNLNSLGSNITIQNASVKLRDLMCEGESLPISCYVFSGNVWNESTVNWSNVNPNSISTFLSSNTISYSNGTKQNNPHWYSFNITAAVEGWLNGNYNQNKGIIFKASNEIENGKKYINKTFSSYNRPSYSPSLSITYYSASNLLSNGTYYINNKGYGDYLRYTTSVSATSGLLSSLGNSICWNLQAVSGGYVIRSKNNPSLYLSVPTSKNDNSVSVITVNDSIIPTRCIWNISVSDIGGCLIQNRYNSRYLYTNGSSVFTDTTIGTKGTVTYNSRVWRIASTSNYGNTSSFSQREMGASTNMCTHYSYISEQKQPIVNKSLSNECWVSPEDFTYSNYSTSIISIDSLTGKITGLKQGQTAVRATHKITNRSFSFTVYVKETYIYKTVRRPGLDENGKEARDMHSSDLNRNTLLSMSSTLSELAYLYDLPQSSSSVLPPQGPEALKKYMRQLPDIFSFGDSQMRGVAREMVEHFLSGTASPYSNSILTNKLKSHQNTKTFINSIKNNIANSISKINSNIYSISKTNQFITQMEKIALPTYSDYTNGLMICLNGIWGYDVKITGFSIEGSKYKIKIEYTLFDHFGLDDGDVTNSGWYSKYLSYTNQFGSWYVLQRYKNCQNKYRPFVTYVTFEEEYNGVLS